MSKNIIRLLDPAGALCVVMRHHMSRRQGHFFTHQFNSRQLIQSTQLVQQTNKCKNDHISAPTSQDYFCAVVSEVKKERRDTRASWGRRATPSFSSCPSGRMVPLVMLATREKAHTEEILERLDIKGNPDQWDQKARKGWSDGVLGV